MFKFVEGVAGAGSKRKAARFHAREVADLCFVHSVIPLCGCSGESFDCDVPLVIVFSTFSAAVADADRAQSVLRASKASAVRLMKSEERHLQWEGIIRVPFVDCRMRG